MFRSDEQRVEVLCPVCSIPHVYRVRARQDFIDDNMFSLMNARKPGDRAFRARLYCVRSGDEFEADLWLYETLHRRTREIRVQDTRAQGRDEIIAWTAAEGTPPLRGHRRTRGGVRLGRRTRDS